jgi:hypothetical protein
VSQLRENRFFSGLAYKNWPFSRRKNGGEKVITISEKNDGINSEILANTPFCVTA